MRRTIVSLLVAPLCVIGLAVAGGCGVTADDTAATVGDATVSTTSVHELASDAAFVQAAFAGVAPPTGDAVLPGDLARRALVFEIQRVALRNEVERWGLTIDAPTRDQIRAQIQQQVPNLRRSSLDRVVEAQSSLAALEARLGTLDPKRDEDLRLLYDGSAAQWDQVCLLAVRVPTTGRTLAAAQRALDSGTSLADLPKRVQGTDLAADPKQGCVARVQLPSELRDDIARARVRTVRGPVVVSGTQGDTAYFYRVESTRRLSFARARSQLQSLADALVRQHQQQAAASSWLQFQLVGSVQINPQYGRRLVPTAQGFEILPPEAPAGSFPAVTTPSVPQSGGTGSASSGSGATSSP